MKNKQGPDLEMKFFDDIQFQHLLTQAEKKRLKRFRHIKRMVITRILRRASELNFRGNKPMG
jgi:hypothetical protein